MIPKSGAAFSDKIVLEQTEPYPESIRMEQPQALPWVSNSTPASASLAEVPDQTTNWNAWK